VLLPDTRRGIGSSTRCLLALHDVCPSTRVYCTAVTSSAAVAHFEAPFRAVSRYAASVAQSTYFKGTGWSGIFPGISHVGSRRSVSALRFARQGRATVGLSAPHLLDDPAAPMHRHPSSNFASPSRAPVDGNGGLTLPPVEGENQGYTSPPIIDPNLDVIYTLDVQVRPSKIRKYMSKVEVATVESGRF